MVSEQQVLDQLPMLRRVARRLCSNRLDAEDLLQDTVMRCLKYREKCTSEIGRWCKAVMRNIWRSGHTLRIRRIAREDVWATRYVEPHDLDEWLYATQVLDRVSLLSPMQHRFMVAWLDVDEYAPLAVMFGIQLGTVKSRISRIRETLAA
jgi:RNA polymerase sigma-70 factor (ECF subfamily)